MMSYQVSQKPSASAVPLVPFRKKSLEQWLITAPERLRRWVAASGFDAQPGKCLALPDDQGNIERCIFGMRDEGWLYQLAAIYGSLPEGTYALASDWAEEQICQASLGWGLAAYCFAQSRRFTTGPAFVRRAVPGARPGQYSNGAHGSGTTG
jgi:leucyl aminopeptidase